MTKNQIKAAVVVAVLTTTLGPAIRARAYPAFLRQAQKFGAKDCLFCHKDKEGGEGWNERGQWLIEEKERRNADAIDVEWLKDYQEKGKEKEPSREPGEKKP